MSYFCSKMWGELPLQGAYVQLNTIFVETLNLKG